MPTGLNDHHAAIRHQAGVGCRGVPILGLLADYLGLGVLTVFDWIINEQQVSAAPGKRSAHANCIKRATL